jgi:hypothetical protein
MRKARGESQSRSAADFKNTIPRLPLTQIDGPEGESLGWVD